MLVIVHVPFTPDVVSPGGYENTEPASVQYVQSFRFISANHFRLVTIHRVAADSDQKGLNCLSWTTNLVKGFLGNIQ